MKCHQCGTESVAPKPEFRALCEKCGAFMHVCLNCEHYDRQAYHECRASATAEYVGDKEKYNFCEEFRPAGSGKNASEPKKSRKDIEKMFGGLS